ncbi:Uma2 family endonuclease [Nonomuraea sp. NPDC049646]|uniref:Uma2 family endonuclease n=1 Tax=unclassified Nonomuraea TaxID=2593643 RepID=UPI00379F82FE
MTAEAVSLEMTTSSLPDWVFPPPGGFVAEDLDNIPNLPAHTELIDGSLVFASPQASFHAVMVDLLAADLRGAAPEELRVRRGMSVVLGHDQRPEPDLVVLKAEALGGGRETFYKAQDVVLAVEVVSPESRSRDRERKPALYAAAGIPHFWRVEDDGGEPVVYVYERDPATRAYALTGIHHDRLKLTVPFDLDVDLSRVHRL